jgi:hypothetical protein
MKRVFLLIVVPALLVAMGFAQTPAASGNTDQINIKGCLGGSEGNYTVAEDNTGKIFKITTSSADLKAYVGQDVNLTVHKAAEASLAVTELKMISEHCAIGAAAPTATFSAPAETITTPVVAAAAPVAAAPDTTASTPAEAVSTTPAVVAAPDAAAPAATASVPTVAAVPAPTATTPAETITAPAVAAVPDVTAPAATTSVPTAAAAPVTAVSTPAETVTILAAPAAVHRTPPSTPRKASVTPAAAAETPAPSPKPVDTPPAAAAASSPDPVVPTSETASAPAVAATKPTTGRSIWMLGSIVVVVLLMGTLVPLFNRWRKQKLLEQTSAENLSFTKASSDPGTGAKPVGPRKAA